jgi:hypothetical protein
MCSRLGVAPANVEPRDVPECDLLGDGGETGDIVQGESIVYSLLELCVCVLVRHIPSLHPSLPASLSSVPLKINIADDSAKIREDLIAHAVNVLQTLPQLSSPKGSAKILSTVLYLVTGVLKEASTGRDAGGNETSRAAVQACLKCLKALASDGYACDDRSSSFWVPLLQSALLRILDFSKTGL